MGDDRDDACLPSRGTIIRAKNGDILRFDSTGLEMVLSDSVISDIARRLPAASEAKSRYEWIDPQVLGDIDAWDLRRDGEWIVFNANLPGAQGVRQFRRLAKPDDAEMEPGIFADGAGPLRGLFSLGGPRRATGFEAPLDYPWHVLAPADDLGAVGHAGEQSSKPLSALERLRETTRDAALGDVLASRQNLGHKSMSLFVARCETDSSASISELEQGAAYQNLMTAIETLKNAATRLERPATLYALGLDYSLEDVRSDRASFRDGALALLEKIATDVVRMGLRRPPILAVFDCGTHDVNDSPVLRAQWDLAWQGLDHGLIFSAPGYMFRQDRYGRPTVEALWQMAEMDACALEALHAGDPWACPVFLLAEREADRRNIRVRARSQTDLVIDTGAPFGAGNFYGFSLSGVENDAQLTSANLAEDDAQDVILSFDTPPEGDSLEVLYAFGQANERNNIDFPMACGALRDEWSFHSKTGEQLHRWALPAALPVW